MNVAILSESDADEAALRVLAEGILGASVVHFRGNRRKRGWPAVRNVLDAVIKEAYWTGVDILLVVADSDDSPVHSTSHGEMPEPKCRYCCLSDEATRCVSTLSRRSSGLHLRVIVGLAVPCLEAWLLVTQNPHVSETAWITGVAARKLPYSRLELKQELYGTSRPSLELETTKMVAAARIIAPKPELVEARFPNGFGPFAQALKTLKPSEDAPTP